jgi:glycosyltransferase involved in cell wall biosynthesis
MLHVVSLPHTATTSEYSWCAYTQKVLKFCNMMAPRGHSITLYGTADNEAQCDEFVCCNHALPLPGTIPPFDADDPMFAAFNTRAISAIAERIAPRDPILLIGGLAQEPIAAAFPAHEIIEFGVGYGGIIPRAHHVYESYAWMHTVQGAYAGSQVNCTNGVLFDTVIPNYFDRDQFPRGDGDDGYLLFVGRLIERKGVQIALDTAKAADIPLVVAGTGPYPLPEWVEYHGVVGPKLRADLMGRATALIAPTLYVEPFGGVAVEAQMCGTPVITTDFGAFTETVEHGKTGFRCSTLSEFVGAVQRAGGLAREPIRERAQKLYSLEAVAPRYERYFERLEKLWDGGFYDC